MNVVCLPVCQLLSYCTYKGVLQGVCGGSERNAQAISKVCVLGTFGFATITCTVLSVGAPESSVADDDEANLFPSRSRKSRPGAVNTKTEFDKHRWLLSLVYHC